MKKNVLILAFSLLFILPTFAEEVVVEEIVVAVENEESEPKSSVSFNGSPYDFIFSWKKKAKESHWTGLGFAFSNLDNLNDADINLTRSYSIILNLGDYIIPFNQNWLFATGLGFDWTRYNFQGNTTLQSVNGQTFFFTDNTNEYRNSKLKIYYATIPLLLEYQTKLNRNQTFFIYGGVEGLVKLYSKSQADIKMANKYKTEVYKNLDLLPLNFRFVGRIGFEHFSIFGYYQPFSPFEKAKGPDVQPFGMGLMLNF